MRLHLIQQKVGNALVSPEGEKPFHQCMWDEMRLWTVCIRRLFPFLNGVTYQMAWKGERLAGANKQSGYQPNKRGFYWRQHIVTEKIECQSNPWSLQKNIARSVQAFPSRSQAMLWYPSPSYSILPKECRAVTHAQCTQHDRLYY